MTSPPDLREPGPHPLQGSSVPVRSNPVVRAVASMAWRIGHGRPLRLAGRLLTAAAAAALAEAATGWQPASAAVITGALTWLLLTGRADLASRLVATRPRANRLHRPGTTGRNRPSPNR